MRSKLFTIIFAGMLASQSQAAEVTVQCLGSLETEAGKVTTAGVSYALAYDISGQHATVNFAGTRMTVDVEYGQDWKGPWLNKMDDSGYFSFHPEDGAVIKLAITPERWFSGRC